MTASFQFLSHMSDLAESSLRAFVPSCSSKLESHTCITRSCLVHHLISFSRSLLILPSNRLVLLACSPPVALQDSQALTLRLIAAGAVKVRLENNAASVAMKLEKWREAGEHCCHVLAVDTQNSKVIKHQFGHVPTVGTGALANGYSLPSASRVYSSVSPRE